MSDATNAKGVLLEIGDGGGSEVFTVIGEVTDVSGPAEAIAAIDVTNFGSAAKEYILDIPDGGEVTVSMNFLGGDAQQQQLRTDSRSAVLRNFKLILNDDAVSPTTVAFAAFITKPPAVKISNGKQITADCTLKISGTPAVWTYVS